MIDQFLASTYGPSRRDTRIEKLAQQLSNLPSGDLMPMAQGGLGAANQPPVVTPPPTAQPTGRGPSVGPAMPPSQAMQGTGLGGQPPVGMESGLKAAAAKVAMLDDEGKDILTTAGGGALGGALLQGFRGAERGSYFGRPGLGAAVAAPIGAVQGATATGLGALAGRNADTFGDALLRGGLAGAAIPTVVHGIAEGGRGALMGGLLGGSAGMVGAAMARSKRLEREQSKEKKSSVQLIRDEFEKQSFSLAGAGQALRGVNWGQLARQNAVPLATGAAGMAAGAYMGGREGGGISGALGGAALGGLGGFAAGKGGHMAYQAARGGGAGGFGARLKAVANREARQTQRALGIEGKVWRPFSGAAKPPVAGTVAQPPATLALPQQAGPGVT